MRDSIAGAIAVGWAEALMAEYAPELNIVGGAHGGTPASFQPVVERIVRRTLTYAHKCGFELTLPPPHRMGVPGLAVRTSLSSSSCMVPDVHEIPAVLVAASYGLSTAYPDFHTALYSLATPKMKALIEYTVATQCRRLFIPLMGVSNS